MKMTIGKVAKELNVSVETIRFYQRKGLIQEPEKPASGGHRHYPEETIQQLKFIRHAQQLEFSLKEISELLHRCENHDFNIVTLTELKRQQVDGQIKRLTKARSALDGILNQCNHSKGSSYSTFFNALVLMPLRFKLERG